VGEPSLLGPDMIYKILEKFHNIRNWLQTAYSRQKSYADHRRRDLEFEEVDKGYLKILLMKGVVRFGKNGKLSPRYVGLYDILQRVSKVAYKFKLPTELASVHPIFHVFMLKKSTGDPESILSIECLSLRITFL